MLICVIVVPAVLTALAAARFDDDSGEAATRFYVLAVCFGLVAVLAFWERWSLGRVYEKAWRAACHVLEGTHSHDGERLTGTWNGRPFEALATAHTTGQDGGWVTRYRLVMPTEHPGPAWTAEQPYWSEAITAPDLWLVRSDVSDAERRLVEAGLLAAIEGAEQQAVHRRPGGRLSFDPATNELEYRDTSGEPPCATDFVVQLNLVSRVVDVHAAAMVLRSDKRASPMIAGQHTTNALGVRSAALH